DNARLVNKSLRDLSADMPDIPFQAIAILRKGKTIIPHGDNVILPGDHLYLATRKDHLDQLTRYIGFQPRKMKNIMMVGGSELALPTAQLLENTYNITLIDPNKESCKRLIEKLHNTLVVQANPGNIDVLIEEGIEEMDAYIALSPNSETNIITSLLVKEYGVFKTIALVDNVDYTHISQSIGVDTIINKKLIAANNIFRFVRKGRIEAITSLHGVDAEVIEFIVHKENRLVKKPIRDLKIPEGATIVGVVRGEESFIPNGDFQFQLNDKVIVFAMPQCIAKIEALFR
ncbi:MAG: Trk system potassium transporter TrkA, partial [Bacteroidetes bacterium]